MRRILSLFLLTLLGITAGFAATETFDFKFETMGDEGWTSNYAEHTVKGTIANVVFASANKQTGTITDVPVTKGGNVTATLNNINSYKITGVKFVCKQWGSKAQTITLNVSGDGEAFTATQTTSDNFTLEATGLDTKAVRFTFSSTSNQVGISSLEITYETVPQGGDQPAEVATPAITVASSFEEGADETLSISCATEGATIYYSIAKGDDYLVESEEYDGAVDLSGYKAGEYAVEAFAMLDDETSDIAEATFTVTEPAGSGPDDIVADEVITFSADNFPTGQGTNVSWVAAKGSGSTNPAWNATNSQARIYAKGTLTVTAAEGKYLKKIQFKGGANANNSGKKPDWQNATADNGTLNATDDGEKVWNAANETTSEVVFTFDATASAGNTYLTVMGVDYYTADPDDVAAPVITVASSFEKGANESLSISCATEDATIYYSVEKGNEILVQWTEYQNEIDLSQYAAGEYNVKAKAEKDGVESEVANATFTITEPLAPLTSLADVNALATDTKFTYGAQTVVMGKKGKNLYIVMPENEAGALIYDANNNWDSEYTFGQIINGGWSGKKAIYNDKPEVTEPSDFALNGQPAEVTPMEAAPGDVKLENFGRYAVIRGATTTVTNTNNGTIAVGSASVAMYNQFENVTLKAGNYDVYGVIGYNNGTPQFMPLVFEEVVDPDAVATPVITVTERFQVGADEAIFITCETEDAEITYSVDKGEENIDLGVYSEPIDLSSYEAGTYIVSAIASKDGHDSDEAIATFTITEPVGPGPDDIVADEVITFSADNFPTGQGTNVSWVAAKGSGTTNPAWNATNSQARIYAKGTLTVTAAEGKYLKKIQFKGGANANSSGKKPDWQNATADNGTLNATDDGEKVWNAANETTSEVVFTFDATATAGNTYLTVMGVDYYTAEQQEEDLTLAEVLELEEPANVNLTTDLGVKKRIGTNAWAFDNNDNWIRLKFADEDAAEQAVDYANIHNLKGTYNGDYKDPEFTVTSFESSEESLGANIWEINLEQGFEEMPTPGQIVQVTGYYQSGGTLRGWSNLRGTSLTLANDFTDVHEFAMDDMENVFVGALYRNVEVAIQYKGDMPANGAPRRISPAEVDYDFQNLVGQLTENSMPVASEMPTDVKTVEGAKEVKSVKYVNTVGQTSDRAFDGVNVMITTYTDGTTNTVKVVK